MIRRSFVSILILFTIISNCFGQPDPRLPKVVPPSPNAAAFQRYGDIPVSAYTGTPDITIPFYEVKSGDITVPISLSYHASGIRVSDEASRVGLGWALNAGGVISRTVVGSDDFSIPSYSYNYQSNEFPLSKAFDPRSMFNIKIGCDDTLVGYAPNPIAIPHDYIQTDGYDLQPDQYNFNIPGHTGKFVLRRDRTAVLSDLEKLDIQVIGAAASSWQIKTPDGTLYKFEQNENYVDYGGTGTAHISSWYLTQIVSPTGHTVDFVYSTLGAYIHTVGSYFESKSVANLASDPQITAPPYSTYYSAATPGKWYTNLYLSKIVSDNAVVQFNYSSGRIDLVNDIQLDSVQEYSKLSKNAPASLLKTWKLKYGYFTGNNLGGGSNPNASLTEMANRLKLSSIQEFGIGNSIPPYLFSYNNETGDPALLPAKISFSRDHWGYYNGKSNSSLIPSFLNGGCMNDPIAYYIGTMGSERNPDPKYNQLFNINKIQYPTGGYTTFEFETNDFDIQKSVVNDYTYFANYVGAVPAIATASWSNIQSGGTFTGTLDLSQMIPCGQSVQLIAQFINTSGLAPGSFSGITYSLKDPTGLEISSGQVISWINNTAPPMTQYLGTGSSNNGVQMTLSKNLAPGIYTWSVYIPPFLNMTATAANIYFSKSDALIPIKNSGDSLQNAMFGGGLRIAKIDDFSSTGLPPKVKKYYYHFVYGGKNWSYGRRMAKPNYTYVATNYGLASPSGSPAGDVFSYSSVVMRESDSNIPLNGSAGGSTVGYDKVMESIGENGEGGKTVYEYLNQPDVLYNYNISNGVLGYISTVPFKPPYGGAMSVSGNGNLIKKTEYANQYGVYYPVRQLVNNYQNLFSPTDTVAVLGIEKRYILGSHPDYPGGVCFLTNFIYPAITKTRLALVSSVQTSYDQLDTTKSLSTTKLYTYNNTTHLQVTSEKTIKSNGDTATTSYKYPLDYSDAQSDASVILMKNASFMHAIPVYQQSGYSHNSNQYITSATISKFQVLNNKIFLKEKAFLDIANPINVNSAPAAYNPASGSYPSGYIARLFFDKYDSSGNIIQVHKSNDAFMTYIWDYSNSYPIAEVSNADSVSVAFTSFEANGIGNWSVPSSVRDTVNFITGTKSYNLSNGAINKTGLTVGKIYIITYWSKNGSYTIGGGTSTLRTGRVITPWTYYEHTVTTTATTLTVTGTGNIDELRLYPQGSTMKSYNYSPLVGMTVSNDENSEFTYFEYDGLQRLKNVKDYAGNIIKNYQYNYAANCTTCNISMQTMTGTPTISYPVGVFSIDKKLLGNAINQSQYLSYWNANTVNHAVGTLTAGSDSMHFVLTLNANQVSPGLVYGLRYWQADLAYNQIDAVRYNCAVYVDFGDGTGMFMGNNKADSSMVIAGGTLINHLYNYGTTIDNIYWIHTYPNSNQKTLTFYHNDADETSDLDNVNNPATSLNLLKNLRGNLPQHGTWFGANCFQQASATSVSTIYNWNSINSIAAFYLATGDSQTPCLNISYAQDFMVNNKGLQNIATNTRGLYLESSEDVTFKLTRLKWDWNTYFTEINSMDISDADWNREDLSRLKKLKRFVIYAGNQNHSYNPSGNPLVPIPTTVIDNIIYQIAIGAGQTVTNGLIYIVPGSTNRSSTSDAAVTFLKGKGWSIVINGVYQ